MGRCLTASARWWLYFSLKSILPGLAPPLQPPRPLAPPACTITCSLPGLCKRASACLSSIEKICCGIHLSDWEAQPSGTTCGRICPCFSAQWGFKLFLGGGLMPAARLPPSQSSPWQGAASKHLQGQPNFSLYGLYRSEVVFLFSLGFWLTESIRNTQLQRLCHTAQPALLTAINSTPAFFSSCSRCYHREPRGCSGPTGPLSSTSTKAAAGGQRSVCVRQPRGKQGREGEARAGRWGEGRRGGCSEVNSVDHSRSHSEK